MAEDGNVAIEVVSTATSQETLSLPEDQPVIDSHKVVETEVDLSDIRSTNPDGAQSVSSLTLLLSGFKIVSFSILSSSYHYHCCRIF